MSLASTSIGDLTEVLQAWQKAQRKGVEKIVKEKEKTGGSEDRGYFHWLSGRPARQGSAGGENIDEVIEIHKRIRRLVREEAGKLG